MGRSASLLFIKRDDAAPAQGRQAAQQLTAPPIPSAKDEKPIMYRNRIVFSFCVVLLTACGGGGGESGSNAAPASTAASLNVAVSDALVKSAGAEIPIEIVQSGTGAISWTVEGLTAAPWITSSAPASGTGSTSLRLVVAANGGSPRSTSLTVSGSDGSRKTFSVEQTAARASVLRPGWDESNPGWTFAYEDFLSANRSYSTSTVTAADAPRRFGTQSQRFEVRPGDCAGADCARADGNRERSEFGQIGEGNLPGQTFWYAWSMYVPEDFRDAGDVVGTSRTLTAGQFMQSPTFVPAFQFGKEVGGDFILRTFTTDTGSAPKLRYSVIPARQFVGHWHDFVVHASWTTASSGFFKLWVNGQQRVDYNGQTMITGNSHVYFKYGVYRIASPAEAINSVLYFDEIRRGAARNAVDIRALEKD